MSIIFKDKHGHRVDVSSDTMIRFAPQGGGFMATMPAPEFFEHYTRDESTPTYRLALFTIDGSPWAIEGYHTGDRWNGWAMPSFTMEQAEVLSRFMGDLVYDATLDSWRATFQGADTECDVFVGGPITVDGKSVHVYDIGSGSWTWDVTEYK